MSASSLRYVNHTYRNFSEYIDKGGRLIKHKKSEANFPAKLHKMLSESGNSHVVAWMPHGRAWKILDKDLLFSSVLPNYFVCKKYESFTRQLNGWGFKRLHQSGPDLGCYYHECFLRNMPKLTCLIRRLPANLGKATPFPAGEPNFYRISEVYPVPPLPSSNASATRSASEAEATASSASHGEQSEIQHLSLPSTYHSTRGPLTDFTSAASVAQSHGRSHNPSTQDIKSTPTLGSITSPLAAASHGHSNNDIQCLSSPLIRPSVQEYPSTCLTSASSMPYQSSHQMPHEYPQNYNLHQPSGHTSYSQHAPYSTNHSPTLGYSSQLYGQYSTRDQSTHPRHQLFQPPQYHPYASTPNAAPTDEPFPQRMNYDFSHESNSNAGQLMPLSSDCTTTRNNACPSRGQANHSAPTLHGTRPSEAAKKDSTPQVYKTN